MGVEYRMKRKVTVSKMKVTPSRYERVKDLEGPQEMYLGCDCSSFDHLVRVSYYPKEDMFLDITLAKLPFWRRIWVGLKYIFGVGIPKHQYGEVIFHKEKAIELKEHVLDFLATFEEEK
jgi:hypothetical protein